MEDPSAAPARASFCPTCGTAFEGAAGFCSRCGSPRYDAQRADNAAVPRVQSVAPPAYAAATQQTTANPAAAQTHPVGFGTAVSSGLSKYASFSGRARRSEFWWFFLFSVLVVVAGLLVDALVGTNGIFYGLAVLAVFLPNLAVAVRRLHDIDKSGWSFFLYIIPTAGFVIATMFNCRQGTRGPNQYGADPKAGSERYGNSPTAPPY